MVAITELKCQYCMFHAKTLVKRVEKLNLKFNTFASHDMIFITLYDIHHMM